MPELECMKSFAGRLPPETPVILVLTESTWWNRMELLKRFLWKFSVPRNYEHHKKMFALFKLVLDNTDDMFSSTDHVRLWLTVKAGWVDYRACDAVGGQGVIAIPKSISFTSMDQAEFEKYYNDIVNVVLKHIMVGLDREDLEQQVIRF